MYPHHIWHNIIFPARDRGAAFLTKILSNLGNMNVWKFLWDFESVSVNFYLWENIWNILFLTLKTELANREFFSVMAHRRKNSHPLCKQKRISAVLDLLSAKTRQEVGLVTLLYHTQRFYIENTEKELYKYKMEWSREYRQVLSV